MSSTHLPADFSGASQQASRVNVPAQLRIRQAVIAALSLLVALVGFCAYRSYATVVQTIGKDSEPSIVAAENIRSTLSDAHTSIINVFLTGEGPDGPGATEYRKSMAQANDHLVAAAQNITYGDEERRPILDIMDHLSE